MKHKNSLGVLVSVGMVLALAVGTGPVALAQNLASSATLGISVSGATGTSYAVGQSWTLSLTSSIKNASVSLCGITNNGAQSCTPVGATDANGSWTDSGSFDATTVGSWTEWIFFPSQSVGSNQIAFTVSKTATSSSSGSASGKPAICTTGFPASPAPAGGFTYLTVTECTPYNTCSVLNQDYTSTEDTANILAAALGASVVATANPLGDTHYTFSAPEYELAWPNGTELPAGSVAKMYDTGNNPSTDPGFTQLLQSICGPSATVVTSGSGINAGVVTGSGSTGTGTGTGSGTTTTGTGSSAGAGAGSLSTINSNLNGALAGFSTALSSVAGETAGSGGSASASTGATGSANATTGGGGAGSCDSTAATTISSSLQTLQGLAGVLSSGNTAPGVLTSIENLINSVAQVISALAKCV